MTSKPNILKTTIFAGNFLPSMIIRQLSTHFLHVTKSPTGVATHMFSSNGSVFNWHNFTYADEIKEWVAPESNKMLAILSNNGIVPVTTYVAFASVSILSGMRE